MLPPSVLFCCFEGLSHPCLPATFAYQTWSTTSSLDCWLSSPWFKSLLTRLASLLMKMVFDPTWSGESNLFHPQEAPIIKAKSLSSTPVVQPVVDPYVSNRNSMCMLNLGVYPTLYTRNELLEEIARMLTQSLLSFQPLSTCLLPRALQILLVETHCFLVQSF